MKFSPALPTAIAKLPATDTCHVVAALVLFYDDPTVALSIL